MEMSITEWRDLIRRWISGYWSDEDRRREATSAVWACSIFLLTLYLASQGMVPSYMAIDVPGRVIAVKFALSTENRIADLSQTRIRGPQRPRRPATAPPAPPHRPPRVESISSMAATRPDYFGRIPVLAPDMKDRPPAPDMPAHWVEKPAPQKQFPDKPVFGQAAYVAMPSAKIGTPNGKDPDAPDLTFDVPVSGGDSKNGADFISLSNQTVPTSLGRPGGRDVSVRRPILRQTLPTVPEWFERKGLDSFVTVRIVISSSGKVESAEVEKTSGFKEIDAEARDAVLQWLFESTGYRDEITVKLNYRLR